MRKNILILITYCLISPFSFCQEKTKESNYLEFGAMYFQRNGKSISYCLGYSFSGKKENTKWSNEIFLISNKYNNFGGTTLTINFDHLSYGKAYNFHLGNFLIKPSINSGIYYRDSRGYNGFQYNIGVNINPRLQVGWEFQRVRISIMSSLTYGLSWFKYIKTDGTNPNSGIFFPIDYNPRLLTLAVIGFKI